MNRSSEGLTPNYDPAAKLAESTCITVFCDFDGTYSVQDVGSSIARKYLGERRTELWDRYEQGIVDAWEYNVELFTGFKLPPADLHAFLETIDRDRLTRRALGLGSPIFLFADLLGPFATN